MWARFNPPKNLVILGQNDDGDELFADQCCVYARSSSGRWMRGNHLGELIPMTGSETRWFPADYYDQEIENLEKSHNEVRHNFCVKWLQKQYLLDVETLKKSMSQHYIGDQIPIIASYLNAITDVPPCIPAEDAHKIIAADIDLTNMYYVKTCADGDEIWKIPGRDNLMFEWDSQNDIWIKYDTAEGWYIDQCNRLYSILLSLRRKQIMQPSREFIETMEEIKFITPEEWQAAQNLPRAQFIPDDGMKADDCS